MSVNTVPVALRLTREQRKRLKALSARTMIPQQRLLRAAVEALLTSKRYSKEGRT